MPGSSPGTSRWIGSVVAALALLAATGPAFPVNRPNERFTSLPHHRQLAIMSRAVGRGCKVDKTFFDGRGKTSLAEDHAFWTVACNDGRRFLIEIAPDGHTTALNCKVLRRMGENTCFRRF